MNIAIKQCQSKIILNQATKVLSITSSSPALNGIQRRLYHENIIEHYENPRNVGSLDVSLTLLYYSAF